MKRFWTWLTRRRTDHGWPGYIINGRIRTSTAALILAFFAISWVHNNYQPPAPMPAPETAVVPPGFVPDPEYTWVPRTNVQTRPKTTEPTTTTETTETSQTETTTPGPDEPTMSGVPTTVTDPDGPGPMPPTTVTDPDGPGPMPPTTVTETIAPTSVSTAPNRSGTPGAPSTTVAPGTGPTPTTLAPAQ